MKKLFYILLGLVLLDNISAQTPINELGMLSLSNGRYEEFHEYTRYERVGSAIIDMEKMKIVSLIDRDSMKRMAEIEQNMTTRFLSIDPMASKYPEMNPYGYCANNPIRYIDPDGCEIRLPGEQSAQQAYVSMLYNSTGNNYEIKDNKLTLIGADANFNGTKSESLINTIQTGMDSKDVFTLNLVGASGDDKSVFIDSYTEAKIDVSDLSKLGETSTALQGAAVGHFLNEVQEGSGYSTANSETRSSMFNSAHNPSLGVEGKIFGELSGDKSITSRTAYATGGAVNGYQSIVYEFNSKNKFQLLQGATSTSRSTTIMMGGVKIPFTETITVPTGELKTIKRIK
jgi:hypothetical protein